MDNTEKFFMKEMLSDLGEESEEVLMCAGLDRDELECMDAEERREALENAGIDADNFDEVI